MAARSQKSTGSHSRGLSFRRREEAMNPMNLEMSTPHVHWLNLFFGNSNRNQQKISTDTWVLFQGIVFVNGLLVLNLNEFIICTSFYTLFFFKTTSQERQPEDNYWALDFGNEASRPFLSIQLQCLGPRWMVPKGIVDTNSSLGR